MPVKAVVGHDPPQIWMSHEEHSEQIVDFTLIPIGAIVERSDRRHRRSFVGISLDTDACIVSDGEEVVDDFESSVAGGIVHGSDVAYLGELGSGVVFEEVKGGNDAGGWDVDGEFVLPDGESERLRSALVLMYPRRDVVHTVGCIWVDTKAGTVRIGVTCRPSPGTCL